MESEKARARRLKDNYNLTIAESDAIDAYQGGVCAICGRPEPVKGRRLSNDHSHFDGLVRGHLCSQCNRILGKLENAFERLGMKNAGLDFVKIVVSIARYVKYPTAVSALGRKVFGWPGRIGTKAHRKHLKKLRKM